MKNADRTSLFDDSEFSDGYIEFTESEQYKKYMQPFLNELLEEAKDTLERTDEPFLVQQSIKVLRKIEGRARQVVKNKDVAMNGDK